MDTVGKYPTTLLYDILQTALETWSCQFWAQVKTYKWYWWHETDKNGEPIDGTVNPDITPDTNLLMVRDISEESESRVWVGITPQDIADAVDWALENYNHLFSWHTNQEGIRDEIDYDAIGADVVLQKIVLGDVIYG
jgi:hypothetical protein